ncbi:ParA family protein [Capnocytophaga sp. oral taxon 878]|uniref:ParA family protein n=1 Tax=Capnocytophaga sp. oral taxon 878 TaxID=1316596 RepID=UPI000D02FDC9|nr:ParA family protein [Capnocytophaga sp. oral taxon 878]AVM51536.1 ParA family protein [Capnocytophaga sp. oral taxon 878]
MNVLVNLNHKGGVGKTTNTIHIGAELMNRGYKVLLIDADNQCDLTVGIGVKESRYTIQNFLNCEQGYRVATVSENFHVLAGHPNFHANRYNRLALGKAINHYNLAGFYDFILVDVPPTGINPEATSPAELALCACNYFFVPLQADMFSIKNINAFLGRVLEMRKYNPNMKFLGMYFSNVLTTTSVFKEYYQMLQEQAPDNLFTTYIRRDTEVVKAAILGQTIFEYNEKCRASDDFKSLVSEILSRIEKI